MKIKRLQLWLLMILTLGLLCVIITFGLQLGGIVKIPLFDYFLPKQSTENDESSTFSQDYAGFTTAEETGNNETSSSDDETDDYPSVEVSMPTVPILQEISFPEEMISLNIGEEKTLEPVFVPSDAVVSEYITWLSDDDTIVTVTDGVIKAVGGGETTITVILDGCVGKIRVSVNIPITGISFAEEQIEITPDNATGQTVLVYPENTTQKPTYLWTSDNEAVVTVDEAGVLTPVSIGEATITANFEDFSASYHVLVRFPITTAAISEEALTLNRGQSKQIFVGYAPTVTSDDTTITWSSSNPDVVAVKDGILTAKNTGYAFVYATIAGFELSCEVNVIAPIESVALSEAKLNLKLGSQHKLSTIITPNDTTDDTTAIFASANPEIATVDQDGLVTAVGIGQTQIVCKVGERLVACDITVTIPLESIAFDRYVIDLTKGSTDKLTVSFYPENTTSSKKIKWAVSDPKIASVDKNGVITALSGGSCVVGATVDGITINCMVNVSSPLVSIAINNAEVSLETGRSLNLSVIYTPSDTTVDRTVLWASKDPNIASVDANGVVTGVSEGTTEIVANVAGVLAGCKVVVKKRQPGPSVTLVFDPGHGGVFVGSNSNHYGINYYERDMNLKVALYCKQYLEEHYEGVTIHMTRSTDTQLSTNVDEDLRMRCALGAKVGADAVISFHFNGVASHTGKGATVLCTSDPRFREVSDALGSHVLYQLASLGIYNRGLVHKLNDAGLDYYAINRYSAMNGLPSILIEHCFMDNIEEWKFFGSDEAVMRLAIADAVGIANYYGLKTK